MLVRLLAASKGDWISLEVIDDVSVAKGDGTSVVEQTKSNLEHNPLSDRAVDLWKTIANWLDAIDNVLVDVTTTHFELYVSHPVPVGALCRSFSEANDTASALTAVRRARAELWGPEPDFPKRDEVSEGLRPHAERVLSRPDREIASLLPRMTVVLGVGDPYSEIKPMMLDKLVSEDAYSDVERWALGWIKKTTDTLIASRQAAAISYDTFHAALLEYVKRHDREATLRSFAGQPHPDRVEKERVLRTYVRQLEIVDAGEDDVLSAINDYLRAEIDRTSWAEKGYVDAKTLDDFENELRTTWSNHRRKVEILNADKEPSTRGLLVFSECNNHIAKPGGLECPAHFTRGSFHALADGERIGWHPDYAATLKVYRDRKDAAPTHPEDERDTQS